MRFIERYLEIVREHAKRLAFDDGKESLTYEQLDERSARIYAYLRNHGIAKEDFVVINLPRSVNTVAAIIGTLKAGAAYVVLEDTYPPERVAFIERDVQCKLVLDEALCRKIYDTTAPLEGYELTDIHDAAYAIYTSGSTGNPKGVLHEYGNIDQLMMSAPVDVKNLTCGLMVPFYFVANTIFFFKDILCANSVYIISYKMVLDFDSLKEFIYNKKIEWIYMPLSYVRLYKEPSPYLKTIAIGGEPTNGVYYPGGHPQLLNVYSSTEAGFYVFTEVLEKKYEVAPVGRPILDIPYRLFDENGKEIKGVGQGELCYENKYVRGYINLPEKTAFAWRDGFYHTGDIARRDEAGKYYIVGRKDDMIKINGNRIEPAEIEARVLDLTGLSKAVAKGFSREGHSFICLYYVRKEAEALGILKDGNLQIKREKLLRYLPEYMVPAYYVPLEEFPLNANGKIAKKELEPPRLASSVEEYAAPGNEIEAYFCEKMAEVLKLEAFSAAADFFSMGGNSVDAIQFAMKCEKYPVSSTMLYQYPVPRLLAEAYRESGAATDTKARMYQAPMYIEKCRRELIDRAQKIKWKFEKDGGAYLFSNSYFSLDKKVLTDSSTAPCEQITLAEKIDPERLYEAANYAGDQCPYIKMGIHNTEGEFLCTFFNNDKPIPVFPREQTVDFGSEANNFHHVLIQYRDRDLYISVSHLLTDGYGIGEFDNALLKGYYKYEPGKPEFGKPGKPECGNPEPGKPGKPECGNPESGELESGKLEPAERQKENETYTEPMKGQDDTDTKPMQAPMEGQEDTDIKPMKAPMEGQEDTDTKPIEAREDYYVDLMEKLLPVSEEYSRKNYFLEDQFIIPERDEKDLCCIYDTIVVDKASFESFCRRSRISTQIAVALMISVTIQRVHPDNKNKIVTRCPVNMRDILDIPNAFQNSSVPHIFFIADPKELAQKDYEALKNQFLTLFEEQYEYNNLASFNNKMAYRVTENQRERILQDLVWYKGHSQILISYLGKLGSKEFAENIINYQCQFPAAYYPFMVYFTDIGDRFFFHLTRDFRTDVYVNTFKEILKEWIGDIQA